jgi:excisionase family DNA binding protein
MSSPSAGSSLLREGGDLGSKCALDAAKTDRECCSHRDFCSTGQGIVSPLIPNDRPGSSSRRLLRLPEAASLLGVSVWTLRRLISAGKLPVVRLTRRIQVDVKDLERLIEHSKRP